MIMKNSLNKQLDHGMITKNSHNSSDRYDDEEQKTGVKIYQHE